MRLTTFSVMLNHNHIERYGQRNNHTIMKKAIITLAFLLISLLASAQTPVDTKDTGENSYAIEYADTIDGKPLSMVIEYEKNSHLRKIIVIEYDGVLFLCSLDAKYQQDAGIRIWTSGTNYSKREAKVIVNNFSLIVGHTQRTDLEDTMTKLSLYVDSHPKRLISF